MIENVFNLSSCETESNDVNECFIVITYFNLKILTIKCLPISGIQASVATGSGQSGYTGQMDHFSLGYASRHVKPKSSKITRVYNTF